MKAKVFLMLSFFAYFLTLLNPEAVFAQLGGNPCTNNELNTAIGCINFNDINALTRFFLQWFIGIGGGVALVLIVLASYKIMTSQGDPRRLQGGQELFTSALAGLILLVFSVFLLRVLGVDVLGLF